MPSVWTRFLALGLLSGCGQEYAVVSPVDINPNEVLACDFVPLSGTQLSRYRCNPVFTGTEEDWGRGFVSVGFRTQNVVGHPFYQIWYTSDPDNQFGGYGLGYAVSSDGTTWEPHPQNPLVSVDRGWDADNMDAVRVVWDALAARYVLAYQGFNIERGTFGLGLFTSPNGVQWTPFNNGNPVLDLTQPAATGVQYCWPVGFEWSVDQGYYGYLGGSPPGVDTCAIYSFSARSLEGGLTLGTQPVLQAGPDAYDRQGMLSAATAEVEGVQYMFYVGFRQWQNLGGGVVASFDHSLNLATSFDGGVTWSKSPDNPLPVALTEPGVVSEVGAQAVGSRVYLWVTDRYDDIGQSAVGYYLFEPTRPPHP